MYLPKVIRLYPRGTKKAPCFNMVVCYKKTRYRAAFIESVGQFNRHLKNQRQFVINGYRLAYWLNRGVKLHPSVYRVLSFHAQWNRR